jgi:hypothetical protein
MRNRSKLKNANTWQKQTPFLLLWACIISALEMDQDPKKLEGVNEAHRVEGAEGKE